MSCVGTKIENIKKKRNHRTNGSTPTALKGLSNIHI